MERCVRQQAVMELWREARQGDGEAREGTTWRWRATRNGGRQASDVRRMGMLGEPRELRVNG